MEMPSLLDRLRWIAVSIVAVCVLGGASTLVPLAHAAQDDAAATTVQIPIVIR